jgi:hypothetical protein
VDLGGYRPWSGRSATLLPLGNAVKVGGSASEGARPRGEPAPTPPQELAARLVGRPLVEAASSRASPSGARSPGCALHATARDTRAHRRHGRGPTARPARSGHRNAQRPPHQLQPAASAASGAHGAYGRTDSTSGLTNERGGIRRWRRCPRTRRFTLQAGPGAGRREFQGPSRKEGGVPLPGPGTAPASVLTVCKSRVSVRRTKGRSAEQVEPAVQLPRGGRGEATELTAVQPASRLHPGLASSLTAKPAALRP